MAIHSAPAGEAVGLVAATAEATAEAMAEDEAAEEVGVVSHLGQFNYQSRKLADVLHEAIAQTVLRASTRTIHPLNLGIMAANRQTPNKPAGKLTVPAISVLPRDTTPTKASVSKLRPTKHFPR